MYLAFDAFCGKGAHKQHLFIALKNTKKLRCPVNSEVNNEVKPHRADLQKKI